MIFDATSWSNVCEGYTIVDGTIGCEDGRLGFLLAEVPEDGTLDDGFQMRFVGVKLANPVDKRFFIWEGDSLTTASLSSAWEPAQAEFVMVDILNRVWSYKPTVYKGSEAAIEFDGRGLGYPDIGEMGSNVEKVVRIGGTVFAVGAPFRVFERMPGQQWREHDQIPVPPELSSKDEETITNAMSNCAFFDMDGFSTSDMYAVGDLGTVWHYDGAAWTRREFPSNLRLQTVTCAGDGQVYITDIRGSLWRGRDEQWSLVTKMEQSLPFADSAWFAGRLWCANDYGMYVLEGKNLMLAQHAAKDPIPSAVALHAHHIDVSPDGTKMLVCGGLGAAVFDGQEWELLFSEHDMDDIEQ